MRSRALEREKSAKYQAWLKEQGRVHDSKSAWQYAAHLRTLRSTKGETRAERAERTRLYEEWLAMHGLEKNRKNQIKYINRKDEFNKPKAEFTHERKEGTVHELPKVAEGWRGWMGYAA